jgi:hypothetical protein
MNTAGVSGGPVTQDLIQDPSLRVRSLRSKTGIQKNALKSDESAFETMPPILTSGKNSDFVRVLRSRLQS